MLIHRKIESILSRLRCEERRNVINLIGLIKKLSIVYLLFVVSAYEYLLGLSRVLPQIVLPAEANLHRLNDPANEDAAKFFIEQTICNYNGAPVEIYSFQRKINPVEALKEKKIEYNLSGELVQKLFIYLSVELLSKNIVR